MSTVRVELNTASTGTSSAISTIRSAASAHDIYTADVTRLLNTSIGQAMNQAIEDTKMHVFLRCGSEMMLVMTRAPWHTCTTTPPLRSHCAVYATPPLHNLQDLRSEFILMLKGVSYSYE